MQERLCFIACLSNAAECDISNHEFLQAKAMTTIVHVLCAYNPNQDESPRQQDLDTTELLVLFKLFAQCEWEGLQTLC
jgi:hypothetical protein